MTVRAKVKLTHISEVKFHKDLPAQTTLRFNCQYDQTIPEDQRFQKATPSGFIELQIDNPAALEQFELNKCYYVDFTPESTGEAAAPPP